MPRYILHFYATTKDLAEDYPREITGAARFTDAIIEALYRIGKYQSVMIMELEPGQVDYIGVIDLEEIADLLREWHRDGVFETL